MSAPAARVGLPATPYGGRRSRMSWTDVAVIVLCLLAMLAGWALIRAHDGRIATTEFDGVAITHPAGWLQVPAIAPALASWTDAGGSGATMSVFRAPAAAAAQSIQQAVALNPAASNAAFTALSSRAVEIDGVAGQESDYAYARQWIGRGLPPVIHRGRQVAWVDGDTVMVVVLEAPENQWIDTLRNHGASLPGGSR